MFRHWIADVKKKTSIPLVQVMTQVVTLFIRSGSRRANPWIHSENLQTHALVSPIKSLSSSLYNTLKPPQTSLKPPTMLFIYRWICFHPGQQTQVWISLSKFETTNLRRHQCHQNAKIFTRRWLFCSNVCDSRGNYLTQGPPNPAREDILSVMKNEVYLRKTWFGRMQLLPKQSHSVAYLTARQRSESPSLASQNVTPSGKLRKP